MVKHLAITFFLLFSQQFIIAQSEKTVKLNRYIEDEKGRKMQSIVAVYKYKGQPILEPINIGVDTKNESKSFRFILPSMEGVKDTNYAFIYFGGLNNRKSLPGYTLAVIGNNQRKQKPALIWVDKNHNLDLSDDGAPDTFFNYTVNKDIQLNHPTVPNATYTANISRYGFNFNAKYIGMLDDYYKTNSPDKIYAGTLYSFREQRINCIAGDYWTEQDSFTIGIKDANCNGIYNEVGIDYIIVGEYKINELPDVVIPINKKNSNTYFERKGKKYIVQNIHPLGNTILIKRDDEAKIAKQLTIGKKINRFKFQTANKEKKTYSIRHFKKKPSYIFVWRFEQENFRKDTAILRNIQLNYSDKINLITFNYGETPKELRTFIRRNQINWMIGQSSQKINNKLYIEQFPTGILTKKRLKVSRVSISPSELLILLQNNQL
jgi:hypothetical protein